MAMLLAIFHPYVTPISETKMLRLASIEGRVKCLFGAISTANTALP